MKNAAPPPHLPSPSAPSRDEAADDFRLDEWPFYWLTKVVGRYLEELESALKVLGLDVPRWRVLMSLRGRESASVSEIAEHAIVKLPTMTKIVQRMQLDGLVKCRQRQTDGRVTEVLLTEHGQKAQDLAWAAATVVYHHAFKTVSAREIQTLNRLLMRVFHNLD